MPPLTEVLHLIAVQWPWYWPAVGGVFGAVLGSFLNCARYRIPHGLSLRHPPSMCPSCKTRLGAPDLVPILSYLALRGRCRHCGVGIGPASLVIEVICTLLGITAIWYLQGCLLAG